MSLLENKFVIAVVLVILGVLAVQIPALSEWYVAVTAMHPHLATIAEGIVGLILLWLANKGKEITIRHQDVKGGAL